MDSLAAGPLVSFVIPAYNCAAFLKDAIDSALAQTHRPIEVVVVNDGSQDDTDEAVRPYADRITYIKQDNKGLSAARNVGFRASHGEFVCFLDADDMVLPDKIDRQLDVFAREPDLGVVISGYIDVEEDGYTEIQTVRKSWNRDGLERLLRHEVFPPHTALIRRSSLEASPLFPEDIDTWESQEDWQLWLELALAGVAFGSHPEPTCLYRQRSGSIRSNVRKHYRGALRVVRWLRTHPSARVLTQQIAALATRVDMEVAAVELRTGDIDGAAQAMIEAAGMSPQYWVRPAAYRDLFVRSLTVNETPRMVGTVAATEFERRIVNRLMTEVTLSVGRFRSARWKAAALLALAQTAAAAGEQTSARQAAGRALAQSPGLLMQRATVRFLARLFLGRRRTPGADEENLPGVLR